MTRSNQSSKRAHRRLSISMPTKPAHVDKFDIVSPKTPKKPRSRARRSQKARQHALKKKLTMAVNVEQQQQQSPVAIPTTSLYDADTEQSLNLLSPGTRRQTMQLFPIELSTVASGHQATSPNKKSSQTEELETDDEQKTYHYSQLAHNVHSEKVILIHDQDDLKMMRARVFDQYRYQLRSPNLIGFLTRNTAQINKESLIGDSVVKSGVTLTAADLIDSDDRIFIHVTDEKPPLHYIDICKYTTLLGIELANAGGPFPVVIDIKEDSYAARSLLQIGDLVVRAQGMLVEGKSAAWIGKQLKAVPVGQTVKLAVYKVNRPTKNYEWKKVAGVWMRADQVKSLTEAYKQVDDIVDPLDAAC